MSHTVEQGFEMVDAAQKNKRILQVGSQRVSSILYAKAREIYASGALGEVFAIDAYTDRDSASGAWVYPIPPDANEQTIDWNTFLIGAPKIPFDAARFFRWRGYRSYGEGLPGDLYVHLLSGIFFIAGINMVPTRAYSTGGLFRWMNAGRDQPDVIATLYDFPKLRVSVHCNSNSNAGEMTSFFGTNGTLQINDSRLTFTPYVTTPAPETYSTIGWPAKLRNEYLANWYATHPRPDVSAYKVEEGETFAPPEHYDSVVDHEAHFFRSVRTRTAPVENEEFGNHTAIACHMANASYFNRNVAVWDAAARQIKT
jgi:predicted dehydrogenase